MLTVHADTLTFRLPTAWDEVTLGQATELTAAPDPLALIALLSGVDTARLRAQRTPDLLTRLAPHLAFLSSPPAFEALPPPARLTLNGRSIPTPRNLGADSTVGQTFDVSAALKRIYDGLQEDELPTLYAVALTVLGIYLAPLYHARPYTDIEQARALEPYLLTLPATEALPLTAFFLRSTQSGPPSGRLSLRPVTTAAARKGYTGWLPSLRRALTASANIST